MNLRTPSLWKPFALTALGLALTLVQAPAQAAPSDAVKKLKRICKQLTAATGYLDDEDARMTALYDSVEAVAKQDDQEAADALLAVMGYPYQSSSVEVGVASSATDALGALTDSGAHKSVCEAMKKFAKKKPDVAVDLARSIGSWSEPASVAALAEMLEHKNPRLVMAAAASLGRLNMKECVGPLVEAFETWQPRGGEPAEIIGSSLYEITGQGMTKAADWAKWWKEVGNDWDPSQKKTDGGDGATGERPSHYQSESPPKVFEGLEVASKNVVIIIDVSGSMHIRQYIPDPEGEKGSDAEKDDGKVGLGGPPPLPKGDPTADGYKPKDCTFGQCPFALGSAPECWSDENLPEYYSRQNRLNRQIAKLIRRFRPSVEFNIVTFSTDAKSWKGTKLVPATSGNKAKAIKWVLALKPGGYTNAMAGLELAFKMAGADTFIFVTDGAPTNKGGQQLPTKRQLNLLKDIARMNRKRNVRIDVVAIADGHSDFATGLADEHNGDYMSVD